MVQIKYPQRSPVQDKKKKKNPLQVWSGHRVPQAHISLIPEDQVDF